MAKMPIWLVGLRLVMMIAIGGSFGIWGVASYITGGSQATTVATVGDEIQIDQRDFQRELQQRTLLLSQQFGTQISLEDAQALGIPNQVLDTLISRALFTREGDRLGMVVPLDQARSRIASEPLFRNTQGQFDPMLFQGFLQQRSLTEEAYLTSLRQDAIRAQLIGTASASVAVPQAVAAKLYTYGHQARIAQAVYIESASFDVAAEPSQAQLQETYDASASAFLTPEYRGFDLVWISLEALRVSLAPSESELRDLFEADPARFNRPERRVVSHLLLGDQQEAEDVAGRLQAGETVETVQSELGLPQPTTMTLQDKASLESGLGTDFADAAFSLEPQAFSDPVQSGFGWHVLWVTGVEAAYEASFEDVKDELQTAVSNDRAVDRAIELANRFDDTLAAGNDLAFAASTAGLEVHTVAAIDSQGRDPQGQLVADLPNPAAVAEVLFGLEGGEESLLKDDGQGGYFALAVKDIIAPVARPLEEVVDQVTTLWQQTSQRDQAQSYADQLMARLGEGQTLAGVAEAEGLDLLTSPPLMRNQQAAAGLYAGLVGPLFSMELGEVAVAPAAGGFLVASLSEITSATPEEDASGVEAVSTSLKETMRDAITLEYLEGLRGLIGVDINEALFAQISTGTSPTAQ